MKGILKWPLILAAVVVVVRVIVERIGGLDALANALSVVALHTLVIPLYLAVRVSRGGVTRPYATLFKQVLLYVVVVRLMVLPTYWLARVFEWTQPRFDGLWGPDVDPMVGFVAIPVLTGAFWVVGSIVFGGGLGSLVVLIMRRLSPRPTSVPSR